MAQLCAQKEGENRFWRTQSSVYHIANLILIKLQVYLFSSQAEMNKHSHKCLRSGVLYSQHYGILELEESLGSFMPASHSSLFILGVKKLNLKELNALCM